MAKQVFIHTWLSRA